MIPPATPYLDIIEAPPPRPPDPPPEVAPATGELAWVQLGAWRTQARAEEQVRALLAAAVAPPPPLRVRAIRVRGVLWRRVVGGPLTYVQAEAWCARARLGGDACWVRGAPALRDFPSSGSP